MDLQTGVCAERTGDDRRLPPSTPVVAAGGSAARAERSRLGRGGANRSGAQAARRGDGDSLPL